MLQTVYGKRVKLKNNALRKNVGNINQTVNLRCEGEKKRQLLSTSSVLMRAATDVFPTGNERIMLT